RDTEIAASAGAMLALLRPAYYLRLALISVDELEAVLAAAARIVGKKLGRPELESAVTAFAAEIQPRLTRSVATAQPGLIERLPDAPDLTRWRNAVDATAQRAGLLVAGDLAAATRMVASETTAPGSPRPNQRVAELVAYSVSPEYFAARRHLDVTVD